MIRLSISSSLNKVPLWFVEACIDTALGMIISDQDQRFIESLEKARTEQNLKGLKKCFDRLLNQVKDLSSNSVHLSKIYHFANSLLSMIYT